MKKIIILTFAVIVLHINGFSQLFDATIDGVIPGKEKEVVELLEKKGYSVVKDVAYPNFLIFMLGILKTEGNDGKKYPVLLHMTKEDCSDNIESIAVYFPQDAKAEYDMHIKRFAGNFGSPSTEHNNKAVWKLKSYIYTIGVDNDGLFHEIKLNKML